MAAAVPTVSVLLPVRNGGATLKTALLDLIPALSPEDEILVVDDGSEDDTPRILRALGEREPHLRVIRTPGLGLVGALNLGLAEARHRWVARADADDRYPAERLACQRMAARSGVVLVTGDYRLTYMGNSVGELPCALTPSFVAGSLIHPQRIPHPGVLYDRDAVLAVAGYQEADFPAEDLGLWLRLARTGDFVGVPHVTVDWRMAQGSVSHSQQAKQRLSTSDLLKGQFPRELVTRITANDVERELASYYGTRLEGVRRVLLARDLRSLIALGLDARAYKEARASLARDPIRTLAASAGVIRDKRRRDRARRSLAALTQPVT